MKIHSIAVILGIVFSTLSAQNFPFPQNVTYPNGYMPTTLSTENFKKWCDKFMGGNFLRSCGDGGISTQTDQGCKVEAMGWASILAAYMGDKETFDGLYKYYKSQIQSHGMMAWHTNTCGGPMDGGSASDGDLDVAFALCVAAWQWGDEYREEAIKVINTVEKLITQCGNGVSVLYGGFGGRSGYGGCNETDISYYTPAFFRVFAEFTDNDAWEKLADDTYIILNNAANDQTGLVPDWHNWEGGRSQGNHSNAYNYSYDACRVPWRITLDYLWNGNEEAEKWCKTIAGWAEKKGPGNINGNYNLDGSGGGAWPAMSFVGGFAVATMVHSQDAVDTFGKHLSGMGFDTQWYHAYLGNMYMLTLTGNMWRPNLDSTAIAKNGRGHSTGTASHSSVSVKNSANRQLLISGVNSHSVIALTSLNGSQIRRIHTSSSTSAALDITSIKKGCYLLSVGDNTGSTQHAQVVTIF